MRDFDKSWKRAERFHTFLQYAVFTVWGGVILLMITIGYFIITTDPNDVARSLGEYVKTFSEAANGS